MTAPLVTPLPASRKRSRSAATGDIDSGLVSPLVSGGGTRRPGDVVNVDMPNGSSFDFDVVAELNYDGDDESDVSLGSLLEDNDLSFLEYGVVDDDDTDDDADVDPVGGGMVLFDGTYDDCDEDDDDEDGVVPWTDARDEVPVAVSGEPDDQHCSVRGHVLLNEYGNCLVRKDAKLVGSNGQRGIFERIVATAKGKSIPLMCPDVLCVV